jgi:hypothetical protein
LTILHNNGFIDENDIHWKVEFWFTGDWKYMALVLGINGPTSNYFCLWCGCHKNERWDMNKSWLNTGNTKGVFLDFYYFSKNLLFSNFFLLLINIR